MRDAQIAIDRLQLKNSEISGKTLDLEVLLADHESRGRFRVMVFQAAARILEKRGAMTNIALKDIRRRRSPDEK